MLGSGLNPFAQMTLGCAGTFGLGAAIGAGLNLRPEQRRRRLFDRQIKREVERRGQQSAPHYSPATTRSTSTTPQQNGSWPAQWNGVTTWTWQQIARAADRSPLTPGMWQAAHDAMASNAYVAAPVTSNVPLEYPLQFVRLAVADPAAAGRCVCVVFGADTSWLLQADGSPAVSGFARMKQNPAQARDLRMTIDGVDHDVADAPEALTAQQAELLRETLSRIVATHGAR